MCVLSLPSFKKKFILAGSNSTLRLAWLRRKTPVSEVQGEEEEGEKEEMVLFSFKAL